MRARRAKMSRLEIAASLTPLAMFVAVFAFPAQSDSEGEMGPIAFDSVGSMLLDMDRERSVGEMERYASLPRLDAKDSEHACETQDLNQRLQEVYAGLQSQIAQIGLNEVARLEQQIESRKQRNMEIARLSEAVKSQQARLAAKHAAKQLRVAVTKLKNQNEKSRAAEDAALTAAVEAALQAAEAALESSP